MQRTPAGIVVRERVDELLIDFGQTWRIVQETYSCDKLPLKVGIADG